MQNASQLSNQRRYSPERERSGSRSPSEGRKKTPLKIFLSKAVSQIKKTYDVKMPKGLNNSGMSSSGMKKSNSSSRLNITSRPVTPNDYFSNTQNNSNNHDNSSFFDRLNSTQMAGNTSGSKSPRGNSSQLKMRQNAERGLELLSKNNYLDLMLRKKEKSGSSSRSNIIVTEEYLARKHSSGQNDMGNNSGSKRKSPSKESPKLITLPETGSNSGSIMKKHSSLPYNNVEQALGSYKNGGNNSNNNNGERRHSNPGVREKEKKEKRSSSKNQCVRIASCKIKKTK